MFNQVILTKGRNSVSDTNTVYKAEINTGWVTGPDVHTSGVHWHLEIILELPNISRRWEKTGQTRGEPMWIWGKHEMPHRVVQKHYLL